MVGLAPPWRAGRVLGPPERRAAGGLEPLESSGSLYLYMRNIRGELEPCARYRTPNPLPVPPARRGRAAFPSPSNRRLTVLGEWGTRLACGAAWQGYPPDPADWQSAHRRVG